MVQFHSAAPSPGGEIGNHATLRSLWTKVLGGSSPLLGTNIKERSHMYTVEFVPFDNSGSTAVKQFVTMYEAQLFMDKSNHNAGARTYQSVMGEYKLKL